MRIMSSRSHDISPKRLVLYISYRMDGAMAMCALKWKVAAS